MEALGAIPAKASDCQVRDAVLLALKDGTMSIEEFTKLLSPEAPTPTAPAHGHNKGGATVPNPLFGVRVKNASESYSTTKSVGKHTKTGKPVEWCGKAVETPSQLEIAKMGAWMKFVALRGGAPVALSDHEKGLIQDIIDKDVFAGDVNGVYYSEVPAETKAALLSDTVSGGLYINPIIFDNLIVTFPLLHSEILPRVQSVDIPRGSLVQGGSVGNPTVTWSTEGTAVTPFDATALVGQLNTTIFPVTVYLQIGRDWLADVPVDAGTILVENIGQAMLKELDNVIINGDGTTRPQGIINATGLTAITADMANAGPPTVSDYESLLFAVGKQYRKSGFDPCFIGNDTSYRRARGIAVGPTDERRVFGMDESSYELLEHDYLIQNAIPNNNIIFGAMKRYRLYRRAGSQVTWISGTDATLMASNLDALFVRGRFGGRVLDPNAFAICQDAQT
jgi:HK97 family phage major capsid protein